MSISREGGRPGKAFLLHLETKSTRKQRQRRDRGKPADAGLLGHSVREMNCVLKGLAGQCKVLGLKSERSLFDFQFYHEFAMQTLIR